MQHKSLFAALLCGALCLTACLKNEESPSVTLVRDAKAQEILANAEKLKAEGEATLILAKADAALKEAQAKMEEANAEYRKAEIKSEEARTKLLLLDAELKQVEIDLAKVQLEEEKVELQRKQAELEALKAEYEAQIARAEAVKTYWEYYKQWLDERLELEMIKVQKDILDAQAQLVASQYQLENALRQYEQLTHQAELDAEQAAYDEREALRNRVLRLAALYYNAYARLLDVEEQLIYKQRDITLAEEGLIDANELKAKQIAANNREINRLQKVVDYLQTLATEDPEDLKDQLTDLFIDIEKQARVREDAWTAYQDVYEEMWGNAPNDYGTPGAMGNDVTYTYTEKFFNPSTDPVLDTDDDGYPDVALPNLTSPSSFYYTVYDEVTGEPTFKYGYVLGYYDEEDLVHFDFYNLDVDPYTGEITGINDAQELYTYYWDAVDAVGLKTTPVRYPELGEGISYDEREPYTVYTNYEFFPLEINRDGYQAYVDLLNEMAAQDRDDEKESRNAIIDANIAAETAVKEKYEAFLNVESVNISKMDAKVEETIDKFISDWEEVMNKYKAYHDAIQDYIQTYEIDNSVERTEALIAYQAAAAAYDEVVANTATALSDAETDKAVAIVVGILAAAAYEATKKAKEDFENDVDGAWMTWQDNIYYAKYDLGNAADYLAYCQKQLDDAQAAYDLADAAYNEDSKKAYEDAVKAYEAASQKEADAYIAWCEAGCPYPSPLYDTWDAFCTATSNAWNTVNDTYTTWTGLYTPYANALAALEAAKDDMYGTDRTSETDGAVYWYNYYQKQLDDLLYEYPDKYDDTMQTCEDAVNQALADVAAAQAIIDDITAQREAAEKAMHDAFEAWKKVAGDDAAMTKISDLETVWLDAVAALGNPVYDLLWKYGVIHPMYTGETEADLWGPWADVSEAMDFDYYASMIYYDAADPAMEMEEYINDLLGYAGAIYLSSMIPSKAWDFFTNGDEDYGIVFDGTYYDYYGWIDWQFDVDDLLNYVGQSPMGVWMLGHMLMGDFQWGSFMNDYYEDYYWWIWVDGLAADIEDWDTTTRANAMAEVDAAYDIQVAINNLYMDEVDDILTYEAVYKSAIEELNALAAQLPDLWIAWWNEDQAFDALDIQIQDIYSLLYKTYYVARDGMGYEESTMSVYEAIEYYNGEIENMKKDNEDWTAIEDLEIALNKLKKLYELNLEMYQVAQDYTESVKAEYEAVYQQLKDSLASE